MSRAITQGVEGDDGGSILRRNWHLESRRGLPSSGEFCGERMLEYARPVLARYDFTYLGTFCKVYQHFFSCHLVHEGQIKCHTPKDFPLTASSLNFKAWSIWRKWLGWDGCGIPSWAERKELAHQLLKILQQQNKHYQQISNVHVERQPHAALRGEETVIIFREGNFPYQDWPLPRISSSPKTSRAFREPLLYACSWTEHPLPSHVINRLLFQNPD